MINLIYVSSAVKTFNEAELLEILKVSRENNSKQHITGMLLFKDGNFLQVLEGEEAEVMKLYEVICLDPRHRGANIIEKSKIVKRQFGDWSMGFRNLNDDAVKSLPGFSQFMNKSLTLEEFSGGLNSCYELLNLFRDN